MAAGAIGTVVIVAAAVFLASRLGPRSWSFLLAGAAGWALAQPLKGLSGLLAAVLSAPGKPPAEAVAALTSAWWMPLLVAALPAVFESLGKYLPLRWMRVAAWPQAVALGIGAGAFEGLYVAAYAAAGLVSGGPLHLAFGLWERGWALVLHAGTATLAGVAAARRRARWLAVAMAAQFLTGVAPAWYQHGRMAHAPGTGVLLAAAEVVTPAVALLCLWWGRRIWAAGEQAR